jgi:hypothetical protein
VKKLENILLINNSYSSNQHNRVLLDEIGIVEQCVFKSNVEVVPEFLKGEETEGFLPKPYSILLDIAMS